MTDEPTDRERIEEAFSQATKTQLSPAMTLYNVMAALGYDFGDPNEVEANVMQFYADTDRNPFVQAQVEARIGLDAAHLERLFQSCKGQECDYQTRGGLHYAITDLEDLLHYRFGEKDLSNSIATVLVKSIDVGVRELGVNVFNDAIGKAIDELLEQKP